VINTSGIVVNQVLSAGAVGGFTINSQTSVSGYEDANYRQLFQHILSTNFF
jgi:hypothetical protein